MQHELTWERSEFSDLKGCNEFSLVLDCAIGARFGQSDCPHSAYICLQHVMISSAYPICPGAEDAYKTIHMNLLYPAQTPINRISSRMSKSSCAKLPTRRTMIVLTCPKSSGAGYDTRECASNRRSVTYDITSIPRLPRCWIRLSENATPCQANLPRSPTEAAKALK